jgi:hypothetical protein
LLTFGAAKAQTGFSGDPLNAVFETKDTDFWKAFDKMETSKENPFIDYMKNGSPGVKGFTIQNHQCRFIILKSKKRRKTI